ncbi:MAG: zinc ribbon domain-containing protein [candidate division Zixibacteria bacterium]|nr:zinc ribbon domain-containing protein [Candidatus Tariuqbacter arcticus]
MPIYEYICSECGREFEELVFSSDELPECPICGSKSVEKKVSAFASGSSGGSVQSGISSGCGASGFS